MTIFGKERGAGVCRTERAASFWKLYKVSIRGYFSGYHASKAMQYYCSVVLKVKITIVIIPYVHVFSEFFCSSTVCRKKMILICVPRTFLWCVLSRVINVVYLY